MTRKAKVLQFILGNPKATYRDWEQFQLDEPSIRLKKVGTTGVLINLSKSEGWIDPHSWADNYQAGLRLHVEQALKEYVEAGGTVNTLSKVQEVVEMLQQEKDELEARLDSLSTHNTYYKEIATRLVLELQRLQYEHEADEQGRYVSGKATFTRLVTQLNPDREFGENYNTLRDLKLS
jgi:hypothetical protein